MCQSIGGSAIRFCVYSGSFLGSCYPKLSLFMLHTFPGPSPCRDTDQLLVLQIHWWSNRSPRDLRPADIQSSQSFKDSFCDPRWAALTITCFHRAYAGLHNRLSYFDFCMSPIKFQGMNYCPHLKDKETEAPPLIRQSVTWRPSVPILRPGLCAQYLMTSPSINDKKVMSLFYVLVLGFRQASSWRFSFIP